MKREYYISHSEVLGENMSMLVYGEGGYPVIAFQAQDAKSNNFEDFGMIDVLAPFIDAGRIQVFSVDNLDEESWSDEGADKGARAWRQEEYFRFVTDELIPRVHAWNNSDRRPIAVGCSMGATHAAIAALRRPDLFQGCIALSGVYSTRYFFGDWMDENLYHNDVPAFLTNMPADHPYVDLYNQRQLVMCVGQGAWELGIDDLRYIDGQLNRLGVKHWCDFWGLDVNHDWPWWRKQMPYFMNEVLAEIEAAQAAPVEEAPKAEAEVQMKAADDEAKAAEEPKAVAQVAEQELAEEPKAEVKVVEEPQVAAEAKVTDKANAPEVKAAEVVEEPKAEADEKATEAPKAEPTAAKPAAKKAPAKRTTTRKAAPKKAAAATAPKAAAKPEVEAVEEPKAEAKAATTAAKPATKRTTTRKTTTSRKATTTKAAAAPKAAATNAPDAPAKKAPAKRTTTRKAAAPKTAAPKADDQQ